MVNKRSHISPKKNKCLKKHAASVRKAKNAAKCVLGKVGPPFGHLSRVKKNILYLNIQTNRKNGMNFSPPWCRRKLTSEKKI